MAEEGIADELEEIDKLLRKYRENVELSKETLPSSKERHDTVHEANSTFEEILRIRKKIITGVKERKPEYITLKPNDRSEFNKMNLLIEKEIEAGKKRRSRIRILLKGASKVKEEYRSLVKGERDLRKEGRGELKTILKEKGMKPWRKAKLIANARLLQRKTKRVMRLKTRANLGRIIGKTAFNVRHRKSVIP